MAEIAPGEREDFRLWEKEVSAWRIAKIQGIILPPDETNEEYLRLMLGGQDGAETTVLESSVADKPCIPELEMIRKARQVREWLNSNPGKLPEDYPF